MSGRTARAHRHSCSTLWPPVDFRRCPPADAEPRIAEPRATVRATRAATGYGPREASRPCHARRGQFPYAASILLLTLPLWPNRAREGAPAPTDNPLEKSRGLRGEEPRQTTAGPRRRPRGVSRPEIRRAHSLGLYAKLGIERPGLPQDDSRREAAYLDSYAIQPTRFVAAEWMELLQRNGIRCFAFTTKHHDGFSLFDTQARVRSHVNWTAPGGPASRAATAPRSWKTFKRDIVRSLRAARQRGIKINR